MTRRLTSFPPLAPLWIGLALAAGLLAATQPPGITVMALALVIFALAGLITPLSALAVMAILAPLRTLVATEAPFHLPLDIGQIALIAVAGLWLIGSIARRRSLPRPGWSPLYLPLIGFIVATGISAFSALSISAWLPEWFKWLEVLLVVVICLDLGAWEWMIFLLVLAGVANAIIGIYEFFGGSGALVLLIANRFFRAFGTFGQPNPFGGFMGLLAPVALMAAIGYGYRFWHRHSRLNLLLTGFYALASALLIISLIFSWSRGAWLGFAAALIAILLALPRKWWHSAALIIVAVGLVVLLWVSGALPTSMITRVKSATDELVAFSDVRGVSITPENYANVERLAHWQAAVNMIRTHPWFGVGFGNYEIAYPQYNLLNWQIALGHAHNYYLNVFAEAGIIGLVGYAALWVSVMTLTWRARRHPDFLARLVVVGLFGTWTYLAVHSLTDNLYVNNLFLHLGILLGVLAVLEKVQCVRME